MATTTRYVTADELLRMSEDDFHYELVRGELRKFTLPGILHEQCAGSISLSLAGCVNANGIGTMTHRAGFILGLDHVRASSVTFVTRERMEVADIGDGYFPGPPDLAVDIVSTRDRRLEIEEKIADYLEAGTKAVIVVYPRSRSVSIHRSTEDTTILTDVDTLEVSDIIPGWSMPVSRIFE